ncbi:hypothetical protein [Pantoea ananatis]|uniref:hypothetical protein n=2 Tax=Pantoea ananas TaxID=553 RepID=UPI0025CA848E|nr:hypothetical protein [Pantoea ananatis]MDN4126254.1 hypothetical protein [Pantoea ananatis]MDN4150628.1 hypothetical protein [Pantoea ananatis]
MLIPMSWHGLMLLTLTARSFSADAAGTETGILRLERRNGEQAQRLHHGYQTQELEADRQRRLPIDGLFAGRCAMLHLPDRRSATDALIAATALQRDVIQVTRNLNDFQGLGVMLLNPWPA